MRILLLQLIALVALFAPVCSAETRAPRPPTVVGDFIAGSSFSLPLVFMNCSASAFGQNPEPAVPPKGVPAFAPGQTIRFKIGKKGQLIGPGFKISFHSESPGSNTYVGLATRKVPNPPAAVVFKDGAGRPIGVGIQFILVKRIDQIPITYFVNYGMGVISN